MFVRMCPYFPFSARVCLNQHHWLANRMREEGIDFRQCSNAFLKCGDPGRLQELADSLTARDLQTCGQKWLAYFTPFFTEAERKHATATPHQDGLYHRQLSGGPAGHPGDLCGSWATPQTRRANGSGQWKTNPRSQA